MQKTADRSIVSPLYTTGDFYNQYTTHFDQDAEFKSEMFLKEFLPFANRQNITVSSYADVGCGGGATAELVARGLREAGNPIGLARGYDICPQVGALRREGVEFFEADFCQTDTHVDLVTLFDVFEHVPDPIGFLKNVAARCNYIGLHIPLDDYLANALLNRYRPLLDDPGHIVFLDTASALNMVAMSGILVKGYDYTLGFRAHTGRLKARQKMMLPFRAGLAFLSPWLTSKLIGGVALIVVGVTPKGLSQQRS